MNDFGKRLPTSIVLMAFAYVVIRYLPVPAFAALVYLIGVGGAIELKRLARPQLWPWPLVLLNGALVGLPFVFAAVPLGAMLSAVVILSGCYFLFAVRQQDRLGAFVRDFGLQLLAALYLFFPLYFMLGLKQLAPNALFFLIGVIIVGDSGAYFVGSAWGRHKIYPLASPRKSLEGLIAAVVTAGLAGWLAIVVFPVKVGVPVAVLTGAVIGLFSQLSDPVESLFKRAAGSKDSGGILPGHGGILDRIDSYIFCAPLLYFICHYLWAI
jgi:phosphatidate cytidylyltransferase